MRLIYAKPGDIITIGKRGENAAVQVCFDVTEWIKLYGSGNVELLHQRPGESEAYPATVTLEGNEARWTVTSTDTAVAGKNYGQAELRYYAGDTLAKQATIYTRIIESLHGPGEKPPEPGPNWYDRLIKELSGKVSVQQGAENAGKLLFVDEKGNVALLTLGAGLKIKDGVLMLDGTVTPDEPFKLSAPVISLKSVADDSGEETPIKLTAPVIQLEQSTPAILGVSILGRTILGDSGLDKLDTPKIDLVVLDTSPQLGAPEIYLETAKDPTFDSLIPPVIYIYSDQLPTPEIKIMEE